MQEGLEQQVSAAAGHARLAAVYIIFKISFTFLSFCFLDPSPFFLNIDTHIFHSHIFNISIIVIYIPT